MFAYTPYRKRQIFAVILLLISSLALILLYTLKLPREPWVIIFKHGFEGGLVGGLCDWFAVWKTYNAIEKDSEAVADEIGEWVAKDLLDQNTLQEQINSILDNPETQKAVVNILETYFDSHENTKAILDRLWKRIEKDAVDYVVNYDFTKSDITLISSASKDKVIVNTIKICVGETLVKVSEESDFKKFIDSVITNQNPLTQFVSRFINIPAIIRDYGKRLKSGEEIVSNDQKFLDEVVTLVSLSADKYILSWQDLSHEQRQEAVNALIFQVKENVEDILTKFILEHKTIIRNVRTLRSYEPLKLFFEFLVDKIDDRIPHYIGKKISERLKSQDPKDFRVRLEWKTRKILENIRINGTLLGVVLGSVLGIAQVV